MKKRWLTISLVLVFVMLIASCGPAPTAPPVVEGAPEEAAPAPEEAAPAPESAEPIYIALIYPMTGDNALFGEVEVNAHNFVKDQVNAAGGINGRKVVFDVFDDRGDPKEAASIAKRVVGDPKYIAGFGHFRSVCTLAAAPIYDEAGFIFLTDSINEKISGISEWVFRYSITDAEAGKQLVWAALKNNPDYTTAALIFSQTDFGVGLKDTISPEIEALGVEIVANESYFEGQSRDYTPQLTKIKAADPDVIFFLGYYAEAAVAMQQARQLGMLQTFWGPDGLNNPGLIELGGEAVEGARVTSYFSSAATYPGVQEAVEQFRAQYNADIDGISGITIDATRFLFEGLKAVGANDKEALRNWLATNKGFVGISGPIEFDEKHDNMRKIVVVEVRGGVFVESEDQVPDDYFKQ